MAKQNSRGRKEEPSSSVGDEEPVKEEEGYKIPQFNGTLDSFKGWLSLLHPGIHLKVRTIEGSTRRGITPTTPVTYVFNGVELGEEAAILRLRVAGARKNQELIQRIVYAQTAINGKTLSYVRELPDKRKMVVEFNP